MPSKSPKISKNLEKQLQAIGQILRDRRKELGINSTTTAEAAEISRITLYRIERGESSVTMGAYVSVIFALGLVLDLKLFSSINKTESKTKVKLPKKIRFAKYKQLKRIAWQLKGTQELTPEEALDLYERNWKHIDVKSMEAQEKKLIELLLAFFGRERLLV